ncbi:MAG: excinuclease ABC subunit UvrA [Paludibacteraceae bacterium]|nr:excinuclease ABC subunit UvrA [Paludibacteraceae bacterium]
MSTSGNIEVVGARVHNLKNITVSMPQGKLTVITGLSGSGKSSLAFDTIFAEGQRRYLETFSSYARGYIGQLQRPDVDKISGLSPVISIDQKTTGRNPRSTVGTITEVYDFLRLLYARAGTAYSYRTGKEMIQMNDEEIVQHIVKDYAGQKILLLAPLVQGRKGHYRELLDSVRKKGYLHVRVDGEVVELYQGMKVDRYQNHFIEVVIDRLKVGTQGDAVDEKRLLESVNKAMLVGDGLIMILPQQSDVNCQLSTIHSPRFFSRNMMDPETGLSYRQAAPHTFSFNSPSGWCPCCKGLGKVKANENAKADVNDIIHDEENWFERLVEAVKENDNANENEDEIWQECPVCHGQRLNKEALSYRIGGKNIAELAEMDIDMLLDFLQSLCIVHCQSSTKKAIAEPIVKEICGRLHFMLSVGLNYLNLNRSSDSLSGGESQRIRLATQIGSRLVNVLYILDEPSIGLHQRDNQRLIDSLKELRDMGNTVLVVEHDEQMMRQADYVVDIGPRAGRLGGEVVFAGTPAQMLKADTLTAQYLRGEKVCLSGNRAIGQSSHRIRLSGCRGNNLKNISVEFPLGSMICVTGVSGSGKSTLINQTLYPILRHQLHRSLQKPLAYDKIEGVEYIDKVVAVDQSPIGRTPRSNPATYTNVFTDIRDLFAQLPESRIRAWRPGRFSFNTPGGRCEECTGNGYKTIRMHFLPDVYVPCEACGGTRYQKETLEVRFKGKTIADVLDMTVNQAVEFFESQPHILKKIKTIQDVGLGYVKLGQSSTTLSGGESQRMKLATELSKPSTGRTVYILDEPTTGLHFEDIRILMQVLRRLTEQGNTVIIIEHNPDVIKVSDWIIDMGPEGGRGGGELVAEGTLEDIRKNKRSLTGQYV